MHMNGLSALEPPGLVHLYAGGGKGKTTAAAGLAVRALGAGKSVLFCQFLKGRESGELKSLQTLGAVLARAKCGKKFLFQMNREERGRLKRDHEDCFSEISRRVLSGEFDVAVLDEILDAVNEGLLSEEAVFSLIKKRPPGVELVLTGHNPSAAFCEAADYYTEFLCKKHPYGRGVPAREGIEY